MAKSLLGCKSHSKTKQQAEIEATSSVVLCLRSCFSLQSFKTGTKPCDLKLHLTVRCVQLSAGNPQGVPKY